MSTVSGVSSLVSAAATTAAKTTSSSTSLSKDDFMQLMLAQLKNQDPLNPTDSNQMASQTAQYTSLETLQNISDTLTGLTTQVEGTGTVASAAALLGKTVAINGSSLSVDGKGSQALSYTLPSSAASVKVELLDSSGNVVRTIGAGGQGAGGHQVSFDGLDDDGKTLTTGTYTYQVIATDSSGSSLPGVYTVSGPVTSVSSQSGTLMLQVGTQSVPLTSVVGVIAGSGQ